MKRGFISGSLVALSLLVSGCTTAPKVNLTPMQIQALQQREYEAEKSVLFASAVSVFQDLGYQVQGADLETGFINAIGNSENSTNFFEAYAGGNSSKRTQATAYVEQITPDRSRIRFNFVEAKSSSSFYGSDQTTSNSLLQPELYQAAFEKLEEALFVRGAMSGDATAETQSE